MTRYKKELKKHGFMLGCDFPYLPYNDIEDAIAGIEDGNIIIRECYPFGVLTRYIGRDMNEVLELQKFD